MWLIFQPPLLLWLLITLETIPSAFLERIQLILMPTHYLQSENLSLYHKMIPQVYIIIPQLLIFIMLTLSYYLDGSRSYTSLVALAILLLPGVIMVFGVAAFALVRKKFMKNCRNGLSSSSTVAHAAEENAWWFPVPLITLLMMNDTYHNHSQPH